MDRAVTNQPPEGVCQIKLYEYWTRYVENAGAPKPALVVDLVIKNGSYAGLIVPTWYNVEELIGNPRRRGKFRAKNVRDPRNRYAREYRQITGRDRPKAIRMSPAAFKELPLEGWLVHGNKGPKFKAIWNPNRPGAQGVCTTSAREMHLGYTQDAPRMHREMHPHDALSATVDGPETLVNPSSLGGQPYEDLRVSDLRDRDVGEEEKASMGGCEKGGPLPPGVGIAVWDALDEEGRAWIREYAQHDETNNEQLSRNTASRRTEVSTFPTAQNVGTAGALG